MTNSHEPLPQSDALKDVFTRAYEIASRFHNLTTAFPEHVYHALLLEHEELARHLLANGGTAYDTALRSIVMASGGALRSLQDKADVRFFPDVNNALRDAAHFARSWGDEEILPEHMLIVLTKGTSQTVREAMRMAKVSSWHIEKGYRAARERAGRRSVTLDEEEALIASITDDDLSRLLESDTVT